MNRKALSSILSTCFGVCFTNLLQSSNGKIFNRLSDYCENRISPHPLFGASIQKLRKRRKRRGQNRFDYPF